MIVVYSLRAGWRKSWARKVPTNPRGGKEDRTLSTGKAKAKGGTKRCKRQQKVEKKGSWGKTRPHSKSPLRPTNTRGSQNSDSEGAGEEGIKEKHGL